MPLAIIQQFAQLRYAVVNIVYTITSRQLRRRQTAPRNFAPGCHAFTNRQTSLPGGGGGRDF